MQKSMKRWKIAVVMIAVCAAGVINSGQPWTNVRAQDTGEERTYGDYKCTVWGDSSILIHKYTGSGGDVVIPAELEGIRVSGITWDAFRDCTSLTSIVIPSSVSFVDSYAFYGCSSLKDVQIPEYIVVFGSRVFGETPWLAAQQENNVLVVVNGTLMDGSKASGAVDIPDGVTRIDGEAFYGCSGLTGITIPDNVTFIGDGAFYGCSGLTSVQIPDGITDIRDSIFRGCSSLTDVTIPDSVTEIDRYVFRDCGSLTSITIPDSVTSIGEETFMGCSSLASIRIPDKVSRIEEDTFNGCSALTSVDLPSGITDIAPRAFLSCPTGMVVYAEAGSYADTWARGAGYTVVNAAMPENASTEPLAAGTAVTIGELKCELTVLPYDGKTPKATYVKSNDTKSDSITVPDEVTVDGITYKVAGIADGAFAGCTSVEEVVLPASLETIGENAFEQVVSAGEETEKILKVKLPEDMENIETLGIENVTNVINIFYYVVAGSNAQIYLEQCEDVKVFIYPPDTDPDAGENPGDNQEPSEGEGTKQPETGSTTEEQQKPSVEKPTQPGAGSPSTTEQPQPEQKPEQGKTYTVQGLTYKVTSAAEVSFTGGKKTAKKLTVPAKVTILGQTFKVTAVGKRACKKYKKLQTVVIGSNVKTIGDEAFSGCSSLKKITVGRNVTTIGKKVFYGDKKLTRMILKGAKIKKIGKKSLHQVPKRVKITAPKKAQKKYIKLLNAAK
ncbi:MAG: leucine-rich repeat domain-containing protein [Clostridium sp.]|nr:leucine-rich repeat domain-containing protein [Clostridium sp.]